MSRTGHSARLTEPIVERHSHRACGHIPSWRGIVERGGWAKRRPAIGALVDDAGPVQRAGSPSCGLCPSATTGSEANQMSAYLPDDQERKCGLIDHIRARLTASRHAKLALSLSSRIASDRRRPSVPMPSSSATAEVSSATKYSRSNRMVSRQSGFSAFSPSSSATAASHARAVFKRAARAASMSPRSYS